MIYYPKQDFSEIANRIRAGDEDAYTYFFDRLYTPVFKRAVALLKNREDAEDATQAVFLKFWQKRLKWNPDLGSFLGWFLTLAERTVIDEYRKRKRLSEIEVTSLETPFESEGNEMLTLSEILVEKQRYPLNAMVLDEAFDAIEAALLEMTPVYRLTFILYYFEGYSLVEVSKIMRCPYSTSKIRAYRARHQILAVLAEVDSGFQKR